MSPELLHIATNIGLLVMFALAIHAVTACVNVVLFLVSLLGENHE